MLELAGPIGALLVLLLLSGFFSSSETAFMAVSRYRLHYLERRGNRQARIVRELSDSPDRLLATILLGNNFANTAATAVATTIALRAGGNNGVILATLIMTAVILVFSEIAPKTFAARSPERLALAVARPLQLIVPLLYPLASAAATVADWALRPFGVSGGGRPRVSIEEIKGILDLGEEERVIAREKRRMLHSILRLGDIKIADIMIPRTQIKAVAIDGPPEQIVRQIRDSGTTRLPVYRDNLDDIVGILHSKDVIRYWDHAEDMSVEAIMRTPFYVPETASLETLLRLFRHHRQHLAMVIDEFGGVEGVVSLEDLLEEIVGDIEDEHDVPERPPLLEVMPGVVLCRGTCPLSLLNRRCALDLRARDSNTLAGFLMEISGSVPQPGKRLTQGALTFHVLRASPNRVDFVRIEGVATRGVEDDGRRS